MKSWYARGKPVPKGSYHSFVVGWRPGQVHRPGSVAVPNHADETKEWERIIRFATYEAGAKPMQGQVRLACDFYFERPKSHYRTGKFADILRDDAPAADDHIVKPDADKLLRAVMDALTIVDKEPGGVYGDDAVVRVDRAWKFWCARDEHPGVRITLEGR